MRNSKVLVTILGIFMTSSVWANSELRLNVNEVQSYKVEVSDLGLNMESQTLLKNQTSDFDVIRTKFLIAIASKSGLKLTRSQFSYLPAEDNQNGLPDEIIKLPVGLAVDLVKWITSGSQFGAYNIIAKFNLEDKDQNTHRCVSYGGVIRTSSTNVNLLHKIDLGEPSLETSTNPVWEARSDVCEEFFKQVNKIESNTLLVVE